ncbi:MAG: aminotransferase class III-fold pyridoxal phosphate-dependent enzyme [Gammaproteobacteria bacterium]|nr:aminotransferase class III-fold pyridoxal phosphate-dependent enzyme [Gammaproteobacteria bacterium]
MATPMPVTDQTMQHYWMPFTANRDFKRHPRLFVRAEGVYYWNQKGERILDGSSGMFCSALGHGRNEIADAVAAQLRQLDFALPFQGGHPAQFALAQRVAGLTPDGLDYVFFCNSGSEAVDTAMKIALAYHHARGESGRTRFVSRERAYHGVNVGGTSLSGMIKNRAAFGLSVPGVVHMRHTWLPDTRYQPGQPLTGGELAEDLQRAVDTYGAHTIAACFVEPIAGSTGVLVPPRGYLERLRDICDANGILLVFDEVICGFGRTGSVFAAHSFGVKPDMITMAKALTNGAQPMGAVAADQSVYQTIVNSGPEWAVELFHGYTYTGHPAACAAGLATLDIFAQEQLFDRAAELSPYFLEQVFSLRDIPLITDIRGYGLLAGLDLAADEVVGKRGYWAQVKLFEAGLNVKMTGDACILAPAFVFEKAHIDQMCDILRRVFSNP